MFDGAGIRDGLYFKIARLYIEVNYPEFAKIPVENRFNNQKGADNSEYYRITGEASNAAQACSEEILETMVDEILTDFDHVVSKYLDPTYKHGRQVMIDLGRKFPSWKD